MDMQWQSRSKSYGMDNAILKSYIDSMLGDDINVYIQELDIGERKISQEYTFLKISSLEDYFVSRTARQAQLRIITIRKLSGKLVQVLGARFDMDYETWTIRVHSSDREYFCAPLNEKGPRFYSHFHLSCVDFFRTTPNTPLGFLQNRKLNRTTRLIRFLESKAIPSDRMYVIRRAVGHLKREDKDWTFLYFCDPFPGFEQSAYVPDVPGGSLPPLDDWANGLLSSNTPDEYLDRLAADGFGFVTKILRDIKSSWKLLLSDMETFLEDLNDTFNDDEYLEAAPYLQRQFLLSLDTFQRDLFYHRRYVSYLITHKHDVLRERFIVPTAFKHDLEQEENALAVLDSRLKAIRHRTTSMLEMTVSITNIKQARLLGELLKGQREDARIAFKQGESIKRLTIVNLFYLPPSFVASVYGMNTTSTQGTQLWTFLLAAILLTSATLATISLKQEFNTGDYFKRHRIMGWSYPVPRLRHR